MTPRRLYALLYLYGSLWLPGLTADCPYKECYCIHETISCVDRGLESLPQLVSNNTHGLTDLVLDLNSITTIPANSLPANLTEISLVRNPITNIASTAFDGSADTLSTLVFWDANFTQIPSALSHMRALKHLAVYDSNVLNWNEDVMKSIGSSLESLFLRNAGSITSTSWLQYYSSLSELTIESCSVSSLPDNALDLVASNVTILSLFNNSLREVPKAISKLTIIRKLNLGNNQISNITWLPKSQLTSLLLDNNNITDVDFFSNKLKPYSNSLKTLTLQYNQLAAIPELNFLTNVAKLDFSYNKISDPNFGSLPPALFGLDLSFNLLPAIPRVMANLTHLSDMVLTSNMIQVIRGTEFPPNALWARLGHNEITELTNESFPMNSTIRYLHLFNNPIGKISSNAFINLPRLEYLNLQESGITRLPMALLSLSNLITFDASNNPGLVCTCAEKNLASLLVPMMELNIIGTCGQTSIFYFFANLSNACP